MRVPRYDKTAFSGRGTRAPEDDWPSVAAPLDVVLFEGWMLGFAPVGAEAARAVSPDLEAVDARLEAYAEELESVVDAWLVVKIGDPNVRGRECRARALLRVGVGCLCVGEGSRPLDGSLCERVRVCADDSDEPVRTRCAPTTLLPFFIKRPTPCGRPSQWVFKWRQQAEEAARAAGKPTLTDDEVRDFVMRYQPAYEAYLPGLYADGPRGAAAAGKTVLMVEVEEDRSVKEA